MRCGIEKKTIHPTQYVLFSLSFQSLKNKKLMTYDIRSHENQKLDIKYVEQIIKKANISHVSLNQ